MNMKGPRTGFEYWYRLIDLEVLRLGPEALPQLLSAAELMGFAGLNITHPLKQAVIPLLTDLSDDARALGAVNTVLLRDGRRIGHNTDWSGFAASFRRGLPDARIDRVVLLGAGGAGAAVAHAILTLGAGVLSVFDTDRCPRRPPGAGSVRTLRCGQGHRRRRPRSGRRRTHKASSMRHPPAWRIIPACRSPRSGCDPSSGSRRSCTSRWRPSCCRTRAASRLPHARRRRHGRVPGGRSFSFVHRHCTRSTAHARSFRRHERHLKVLRLHDDNDLHGHHHASRGAPDPRPLRRPGAAGHRHDDQLSRPHGARHRGTFAHAASSACRRQ